MRTHVSESNKDKRIVALCLSLLTLSLGSILFVLWLQYRLGNYHPTGYTPQLTTTEQKTVLTKATQLREKWRSWALAHREELKQMLQAQGDGYAEVDRVWRMLPVPPNFTGSQLTNQDFTSPPYMFTWTALPSGMEKQPAIRDDKVSLERLKKSQSFLEDQRRQYARRFHDLAISQSVAPGHERITLWASGRITRTIQPDHYTPGTSPTEQNTDEEIVAPFDFLQ